MYCGKCGKEIPDGTKFCGHCGAEQATSVSASAAKAASQKPSLSVPKAALTGGLNIAFLWAPILNFICMLFTMTKGYHIYGDNYSMYSLWNAFTNAIKKINGGYIAETDSQAVSQNNTVVMAVIIIAVIFFILSVVFAIKKPGKKIMVMSALSALFIAFAHYLDIAAAEATIAGFGRYSSSFGINGIAKFSEVFAIICAIIFVIAAIITKSKKKAAVQQ